MDVPCVVTVARVAESSKHLAMNDLREADHGVERCAKLVTHIGKELRFGEVCALGLVAARVIYFFFRALCSVVSRVTATTPARSLSRPNWPC